MPKCVIHSADLQRPLAVISLSQEAVDTLRKEHFIVLPTVPRPVDMNMAWHSMEAMQSTTVRACALRSMPVRREYRMPAKSDEGMFIYLDQGVDEAVLEYMVHDMLPINVDRLSHKAEGQYLLNHMKDYLARRG